MRNISIKLEDNPISGDAITGLYTAINTSYPELNLTKENSTIIDIRSAIYKSEPNRTRLFIKKNDVPDLYFEFFYNRFNVNDLFTNPYFEGNEISTIQSIETSVELLEYIKEKSSINLSEKDFWVDKAGIDYSGGEITPNWILRSMDNSPYFTGTITLWLHNGNPE